MIERIKKEFQVNDYIKIVCLPDCNELEGIILEFFDSNVKLKTQIDEITISDNMIGSWEKVRIRIIEQIKKECQLNDSIKIIRPDGKEIIGVIIEFGSLHLKLKTQTGEITLLEKLISGWKRLEMNKIEQIKNKCQLNDSIKIIRPDGKEIIGVIIELSGSHLKLKTQTGEANILDKLIISWKKISSSQEIVNESENNNIKSVSIINEDILKFYELVQCASPVFESINFTFKTKILIN